MNNIKQKVLKEKKSIKKILILRNEKQKLSKKNG